MNASLQVSHPDRTPLFVAAIVGAWLSLVVGGAHAGIFARLWQPVIAAMVAATIVLPFIWYRRSPALRAWVDRVGHRRIMLFHVWRIPAALLFFWYGWHDALPLAFWLLAGTGDLIAGLLALAFAFAPERAERYRTFHRFGFADFVVAVGTGLSFTLIEHPSMAPIAALPLALVPLFGVGLSGASHLIAFDMLRRGTGLSDGVGTGR